MTKMDQFIKAAELMFALSRELGDDGINSIDWGFTYHGTSKACEEIKRRMDRALVEYANGKLTEVA